MKHRDSVPPIEGGLVYQVSASAGEVLAFSEFIHLDTREEFDRFQEAFNGALRRHRAGSSDELSFYLAVEDALEEAKTVLWSLRFNRHDDRILRPLGAFRWFCGQAHRDIVDLACADLRRGIRDMRAEGRGKWFIALVVLWHTAGAIAPILWDGLLLWLRRLLPILSLVKKVKGPASS